MIKVNLSVGSNEVYHGLQKLKFMLVVLKVFNDAIEEVDIEHFIRFIGLKY